MPMQRVVCASVSQTLQDSASPLQLEVQVAYGEASEVCTYRRGTSMYIELYI